MIAHAVRVVATALVLAGCTATSTTSPALKTIDPAGLQATVAKLAGQMRVPGAVVVLRTPQGNVTAAVGTTELDTQTPPTAGTHFRIASNTKTMTAALIMLLAQDGKLRLTDPVADYVPNVPNANDISTRLTYKTNAPYGRIGVDFNLMKKIGRAHV